MYKMILLVCLHAKPFTLRGSISLHNGPVRPSAGEFGCYGTMRSMYVQLDKVTEVLHIVCLTPAYGTCRCVWSELHSFTTPNSSTLD